MRKVQKVWVVKVVPVGMELPAALSSVPGVRKTLKSAKLLASQGWHAENVAPHVVWTMNQRRTRWTALWNGSTLAECHKHEVRP